MGSGHGLYAPHHELGMVTQQVCLAKQYQLHRHAQCARSMQPSIADVMRWCTEISFKHMDPKTVLHDKLHYAG